MKQTKRVYPPGVKVYFSDAESQKLLERLKQDSKKYKVSVSKIILFSIEFGLPYVESSFDDMKPKPKK